MRWLGSEQEDRMADEPQRKHGGGYPPKLDQEVAETICAAIAEGCYLTVAAARVGVIAYTIYCWNQRGKREMHQREDKRLHAEAPAAPLTHNKPSHIMPQ